MESQQSVDPSSARDALADVSRATSALGSRMRTPWWYHVGLAAAVGALCASFAFGSKVRGVVLALAICAVVGLVRALIAKNGAWVSGFTATGKPRTIATAMGLVGGLGFAGSMLAKDSDYSWICFIIGAVVFAVMAAGGWKWDAAYRESLEGQS